MKKLPDLTLNDWLQAEEAMRKDRILPRAKNTITAEEYSRMKGCCSTHANKVLKQMCEAGLATREKWHNGVSGTHYVYQLKNGKAPR